MSDRVLERDVIARLMQSGAIGPEDARRFGKLLGIDPPTSETGVTARSHVFDLSHSCQEVSAVGNHAVWAAALWHVSKRDGLDAYVIPPPALNPRVREIWNAVFGDSRILSERAIAEGATFQTITAPAESEAEGVRFQTITAPAESEAEVVRFHTTTTPAEEEKALGSTAKTAFEDILWQNGMSLAPGEKVDVPVLWHCDPDSRRVMIAPVEYTEGNRYYDAEFWLARVREIRAAGYEVNLFGVQMSNRDADGHGLRLIGRLVASGLVSRNYGSTIEEFRRCIGESCLAVAASTGPTWLSLFSNIPQVMLCSPRVTSPQWRCEANAAVITKPVKLVFGKGSLSESLANLQTSTKRFQFDHGLGDVANAARLLQIHLARGVEVHISCPADKEFVFLAAGARVVQDAAPAHPWPQPTVPQALNFGCDTGQDWAGNKIGGNINHPLLGEIGDRAALWRELCETRLDISTRVHADVLERVRQKIEDLPRPLMLLHTTGNTCQAEKSIPRERQVALYRELLDRTRGSVVLLDWDNRVEALASYRLRHMNDLFGHLNIEELVALISLSDLVIGVDSGPIHLAGLTRTPSVGVFRGVHHHPAAYCLPHDLRLTVTESASRELNLHKRIQFGIAEAGEQDIEVVPLARLCAQMAAPCRYLPQGPIAADVQLQQFVSWCNGGDSGMLSLYADRHTSFDIVLCESTARFKNPQWVETGCIRCGEDWAGAGYSTYLFGAYLSRLGGRLHSVDLSPEHCRFARERTAVFGETVQVHEAKGAAWLASYGQQIDVLYLDSMDTTLPGHQESCLEEVEAGLARLHGSSLILIDDTPYHAGRFAGKGGLAVPWLLKRGWRILYAGYQVLMERVK